MMFVGKHSRVKPLDSEGESVQIYNSITRILGLKEELHAEKCYLNEDMFRKNQ